MLRIRLETAYAILKEALESAGSQGDESTGCYGKETGFAMYLALPCFAVIACFIAFFVHWRK